MPIRRFRWLACTTIALIVLGAVVGTATAARGISITNGVSLAVATGTLSMDFPGFILQTCTMSFGLELNRSFTKSPLAQVGRILPSGGGSSITNCEWGIFNHGALLPGTALGYMSVSGTLPNMTTITTRANNFSILFNLIIVGQCLYTGPVNMAMSRNTVTGRVETIVVSGSLDPSNRSCPAPVPVTGSLSLQSPPIVQLI